MRIAIIGKHSYIGEHIRDRFVASGDKHEVIEVDAHDDKWKDVDFEDIDTVIHVAAIVHNKKIKDWNVYHQINTVLPVEVAKKAKASGVKQFVFISTMGVYGVEKKLRPNIIDENSIPHPIGMYGKSKYEAELQLKELESDFFKLIIVRPPNVYGKDCRGGYISGFTRAVNLLPFIPCAYENVKQSMIYIDNLSELIYELIIKQMHGTFMPQDNEAVSAVELMEAISNGLNIKKKRVKIFNPLINAMSFCPIVKKVYGGIEYSCNLSNIDNIDYVLYSINEGIREVYRS